MKLPKFSTLLAVCVAVITAVIILPKIFPGFGGSSVWLLLLACPLMHLFMMRGHDHDDEASRGGGAAGHSCCGNSKPSAKDKQIKGHEHEKHN